MTKKDKRAVIRAFSKQYKYTTRNQKSELLNRLVLTTGYSRKYLMETPPSPPQFRRKIRRKRLSEYAINS